MLHLPSSAHEIELRNALVECGRLMYQRKLITATDGNFSVRLSNGNILITPAGIAKGRMSPDDMLILNIDGEVISSRSDRKPSTETAMHLEVYKWRENVHAVIHAHPVFATTITVANLDFPNDVLPEVMATLGSVPITEYATPSSHEDAEAIRPFLKTHNAVLLRQHGSLTYGKTLEEALIHLERIEHAAEVFWRAKTLGEVQRIPPEAQKKLMDMREKFFKAD